MASSWTWAKGLFEEGGLFSFKVKLQVSRQEMWTLPVSGVSVWNLEWPVGAVFMYVWVCVEGCQVDLWKLVEPRLRVYSWVLFVYTAETCKCCVDVKGLCIDVVWSHCVLGLLRCVYPQV